MVLRRLASWIWFAAAFGVGAGPALSDSWRDGSPMEAPRTQVRAVSVSSEIYVAGGASILGPRDDFEVYDPVSDHWHAMPAMPKGREMFGMAALGPVIYVAGGLVGSQVPSASDEVWRFDTGSSQWSRGPSLPGTRVGLALAAVGGALYAIGGSGTGSDRVLKLLPATNEWEPVGKALAPRRTGHALAVDGTRIYVAGGRSLDGELLSLVDVFDTQTERWGQAPNLPRPAMSLTADFVDGHIHVAGGMVPAERRTLADHYALDPKEGRWRKMAALPTPRQGLSSAPVGKEWFVIGGGSGSGAYTVFTASDAVEVWR